ncbi:MAG: 4Fe-4S binding protein [Desulfurococcaceae archaeon]|uniref:Ferredoxin n=1 Tax=Staphylothermus marinus TaxID=2280 RepID=A0A7C4HB65_STAMA
MRDKLVIEKPVHDKLPIARPRIGVAGKTGTWRVEKPVVDNNKCKRCYQCEIYCPVNSIRVEPETGVIIDYEYCKGCGICADVCLFNAIQLIPE